ncbi:terminase TerL endonuclease subunit [Mesorhizobium sp. M1423]|uniref:terminase TerL endonuclease subunit n=1 Tax=Mesorhizobium sp. M1423 TaxID=2957101 RepID=UPI00333E09FA
MLTRQLCHGGNPLLRWSVGNVVMMSDQSGNRRPNKAKAADRIDPAVAGNHGVRAGRGGRQRPVYVRLSVGGRAVLLETTSCLAPQAAAASPANLL